MGIVFSHMLIILLRAPSTQFKENSNIQVLYPFHSDFLSNLLLY
jgi:hypothetical protein